MYASRNRTVYASRNMVLYDATSALRHLEPVHSWEKTPSLSLEQDHSQGDHLLIPGQLDEEVPEEEESHVGFSMMTQSHPKWTLTHFSSEKSRETMVLMSVIRRKLLVSSRISVGFLPFDRGSKCMAVLLNGTLLYPTVCPWQWLQTACARSTRARGVSAPNYI